MLSKDEIRQQILNGDFKSLGQLLPLWPISQWADIWRVNEANARKKIGGKFQLILRDAVCLSFYFDIPLKVMVRLVNAEMEHRTRKRDFTLLQSRGDIQDLRCRTLYKIIDILQIYLLSTNPEFVDKSPKAQRRQILNAVSHLLKSFDPTP
jgi:hypothetical protein